MESPTASSRSDNFSEEDAKSANILYLWAERSGLHREFIRKELIQKQQLDDEVHPRNFNLWFTKKRVTARDPETLGERVVALIRLFVQENKSRYAPVIQADELETFITFYPDIPARHKLQLRRILYELQVENATASEGLFLAREWQQQFAEWTTFAFVVDKYFCIRAYSRYSMELAGLREEDATHWYWWHRLALGSRGQTKYAGQNSLKSLRGPYADTYYTRQLLRFIYETRQQNIQETKRYEVLMRLLHKTSGFTDLWQRAEEDFKRGVQPPNFVPVPFFRPDDTLLWMLEVSASIPNTEGFRFAARFETDPVTSEYLADIRRLADEPNRYSQKAFFIEDYADNFTDEEKFALGIDS